MNLIVDCREKALSKYLNALGLEHSSESLPLGDIVIKNNEGQTLVLFERKTLQDLLSSIADGRYDEQSFRLMECGLDKHRIYYIIEGNIENYVGKGSGLYSKSTIHSCIYSLSYVKGFSLICSNSLTHTGDILEKFYTKMVKEGGVSEEGRAIKGTYLDSVKLQKKGNISDEMVSVMMLAQIPKVSKSAAETIMKEYDYSIGSLVKALESDDTCLDTLKCQIANNKERKLSKQCVAHVKKYLHTIRSEQNDEYVEET
jgi:ERCC4-type nuclease